MSNLYQIFMSIQGLIMNRLPLENEPGHGPPANSTEDILCCHFLKCISYNFDVRVACMIAGMLEPLRAPPRSFETAAALHFGHKRFEIAAQCVHWCEEAVLLTMFAQHIAGSPIADRLGRFLVPAQPVFVSTGPPPRLGPEAAATWAGPKSMLALVGELARVKQLRLSLFYPGRWQGSGVLGGSGGSGGGGGGERSSATAEGGGGGGEGEWAALKQLHPFWMAMSTLRAAEQVMGELARVATPEGLSGDGSIPQEDLPQAKEADAQKLYERLIASASARKDDIGGGWTSGKSYEQALGL